MSRQYHYLIAGLPDILFDDNKIPLTSKELAEYLSEYIPAEDMELIKLYFWRFDNENILKRLEDSEAEIDSQGNLTSDEIDEVFSLVKEGSLDQCPFEVPEYLGIFIEAFRNEAPLYEGKSWELQLSDMYYEFATAGKNQFVSKWFAYERDLNNFITATKCRNNNIEVENQLIGTGEVVDKMARSNARDFGLNDEIQDISMLLKALDETDLLEQEKKIDFIKWNFLTEEVFFFYFTIEKLFTFAIQLSLAERWVSLDKETGKQLFNELLNSLESSYEFPSEFSLN